MGSNERKQDFSQIRWSSSLPIRGSLRLKQVIKLEQIQQTSRIMFNGADGVQMKSHTTEEEHQMQNEENRLL